MKKSILLALTLCLLVVYGCKKQEDAPVKNIVNDLPLINVADYVALKEKYKGKVILVNFFASWCPPCIEETPDFVKTYNNYKDKNFVIIGISTDDDKNAAIKFVNKHGMEYPVYLSDKAIEKKYMVSKYPTTFVYDKSGNLVDIYNGIIDGKLLTQIAESGAN